MGLKIASMRRIFTGGDLKYWLGVIAYQVLGEPIEEDNTKEVTEAFLSFRKEIKAQLDSKRAYVDTLTDKLSDKEELDILEEFERLVDHASVLHLSKFFREGLGDTSNSLSKEEQAKAPEIVDRFFRSIGATLGIKMLNNPSEKVTEAFKLWSQLGDATAELSAEPKAVFLLNRVRQEIILLAKVIEKSVL